MGGEDVMQCTVCENGEFHFGKAILCQKCAHPDMVRTYCIRCCKRLNLSLPIATALFRLANLNIDRTGVTLRFNHGCPMCVSGAYDAPDIFTLDLDDFPICQIA